MPELITKTDLIDKMFKMVIMDTKCSARSSAESI